MKRLWFMVVLNCVFAVLVFAVDDERGDAAMAKRYVAWAETAIAEGHWPQALVALERGMDFVDVSSDMSYLLARARLHERQNAGAVLEAIRYAESTRRWDTYTLAAARFLEAETLTQLRAFSEALDILSTLPQNADTICLWLTILEHLDERQAFRAMFSKALTDYPRDPRPVHIFLEYAVDRLPEANERDLMAIALRRLPFPPAANPSCTLSQIIASVVILYPGCYRVRAFSLIRDIAAMPPRPNAFASLPRYCRFIGSIYHHR